MPYQVSFSTTVYSRGPSGVGVGSAGGVGSPVAAGAGVASPEGAGVSVGAWDSGEATGRGAWLLSDDSPGREGGRTRSQRARTLAMRRPRREARKTALEGAALTGSRQSAQRSSPW